MTSPYLDRPLVPLAVALPQMLGKIEIDIATASPAKKWRLRERAELVRALLTPSRQAHDESPTPGAGTTAVC
jgi:hypothetical protein